MQASSRIRLGGLRWHGHRLTSEIAERPGPLILVLACLNRDVQIVLRMPVRPVIREQARSRLGWAWLLGCLSGRWAVSGDPWPATVHLQRRINAENAPVLKAGAWPAARPGLADRRRRDAAGAIRSGACRAGPRSAAVRVAIIENPVGSEISLPDNLRRYGHHNGAIMSWGSRPRWD
jgi:hypothetical protein